MAVVTRWNPISFPMDFYEDPTGSWVLWESHNAATEELQEKYDRLLRSYAILVDEAAGCDYKGCTSK